MTMRSGNGTARYRMLAVLSVFSCLGDSTRPEHPKGVPISKVSLS